MLGEGVQLNAGHSTDRHEDEGGEGRAESERQRRRIWKRQSSMGLKSRSMISKIPRSQGVYKGGNSRLCCRGNPHTALRIHAYKGFPAVNGSDPITSSSTERCRSLSRIVPKG